MRLARPGFVPSVETAIVNCPRRRTEGRMNEQYSGTSTMLTGCPRSWVSAQMACISCRSFVAAITTITTAESGALDVAQVTVETCKNIAAIEGFNSLARHHGAPLRQS